MRHVLPFKVLEREMQVFQRDGKEFVQMDKVSFMNMIRMWLMHAPFDEQWYRWRHDDIDRAITDGRLDSCHTHFVIHGYFEGRTPYESYICPADSISEFHTLPDKVRQDMDFAHRMEREGHWDEALTAYRRVAVSRPSSFQARYRLGMIFYNRRMLLQAEQTLAALQESHPGDADVLRMLVQIADHFRQLDRRYQLSRLLESTIRLDTLSFSTAAHALGHLRESGNLCEKYLDRAHLAFPSNPHVRRFGQRVHDEIAVTRSGLIELLSHRRHSAMTAIDFVEVSFQLARLGWHRFPRRLLSFAIKTASANGWADFDESTLEKIGTVKRLTSSRESETNFWRTVWASGRQSEAVATCFADSLYNCASYGEASGVLTLGEKSLRTERATELLCNIRVKEGDFDAAIALCSTAITTWPTAYWPIERCISAMFAAGTLAVSQKLPHNLAGSASMSVSIPKVVMQFWDKPTPPPEVSKAIASWKDANPDFSHIVFSDNTACQFILENYGSDYVKAFKYCHHAAMRSDFFRLAYLAVKGGVYVDADEICLGSISDFLGLYNISDLYVVCSHQSQIAITNGFLACIPGHSIIQQALQTAVSQIGDAMSQGTRTGIWEVTGPGQLSRAVVHEVLRFGKSAPQRERFVSIFELGEYWALSKWGLMDYQLNDAGNWRA